MMSRPMPHVDCLFVLGCEPYLNEERYRKEPARLYGAGEQLESEKRTMAEAAMALPAETRL
jgi:hypothetical protein